MIEGLAARDLPFALSREQVGRLTERLNVARETPIILVPGAGANREAEAFRSFVDEDVPATLKAWIDLIARARVTFHYTERGPEGLLTGKKAYLLVASGGTPVGGAIDFATPWLKHVLAFVGITDVEVIAAERLMIQGEAGRQRAIERIASVLSEDMSDLVAA